MSDEEMRLQTDLNRRILLVEDEESLRKAYARILDRAGFEVHHTGDGRQAIKALEEIRFHAIVSDIAMPGMTGLELLRTVRSIDLDVPVLLITGNPSMDSAVLAVEMGVFRYLIKPVRPDELIDAVGKACKMGRLARVKRDALAHLDVPEMWIGDRTGLEVHFSRCLRRLWLAYQPIVDWQRRTIIAYEALLRCSDPVLPNPGAILQAAERLERVHEVGQAIRAFVARDIALLPSGVDLFLNLHPLDFRDETLYSPTSPLAPHARRIVLEVKERARLDGLDGFDERVGALRRMGFRIAVDDLGAGYAGLSYFSLLVPEVVKIDMSLVRNIHGDLVKRKLVGSLAGLCRELGMTVVAEGVESPEEREVVMSLGCHLLQGYLFARPGPPFPDVAWK